MNTPQDSRPDTLDHIWRVRELLYIAQNKLLARGFAHDQSKLQEPEKSAFDRLKALSLSGMDYGSEEYRACLKAEKPAIDHHYAKNSHHPEHFKLWKCPLCKEVFPESATKEAMVYESKPRFCPSCCPVGSLFEATLEPHSGIDGMTLLDVLEMLIDWKAATERMKDGGDIMKSLEINRGRFSISPQLESILLNTIREMGWVK